MAAIAAAVAVAATTAATAASAVSASKKAKAAKKGITSTTTPQMTPMGEAIQGTMVRLLMNRLNKPPQSFGDFMQSGPQAPLDMNTLSRTERLQYGLGEQQLPFNVNPAGVNPALLAAFSKLGLSPQDSHPSINQSDTPPATWGGGPLGSSTGQGPVTGPRR